jgi:hypothetical protein
VFLPGLCPKPSQPLPVCCSRASAGCSDRGSRFRGTARR